MSSNKRPKTTPSGEASIATTSTAMSAASFLVDLPASNQTHVVSAPAILAAIARSPAGSAIQRSLSSSSTSAAQSSPVMASQFSSAFLALSAEPPTTPGGDDPDTALYNEIAALTPPPVIFIIVFVMF